MRKITYLFIGMLLLNLNLLRAQEDGKIEIKQNFGVIFIQNGKTLNPKQLLEITKSIPDAYHEMKIAKSNYTTANTLSFTGGFIVGWQLGNVLMQKEVNYYLFGLGGGLIGVSLLVSQSYSKHAKKAVEIYNNSLTQINTKNINIQLGLTSSGLGIIMNF